MNNISGFKQIFFGGSVQNTKPINKPDNLSPSKKPAEDALSFGNGYQLYPSQYRLLNHLKTVTTSLNLPDFYTGKLFQHGKSNVSVEHLIPHSKARIAAKSGVRVNALENWVPVDILINKERDAMSLKDWYLLHPEYLEKGIEALRVYETVNTGKINGKEWVAGLKKTLNGQLGYIAFSGRNMQKPQNLSYKA